MALPSCRLRPRRQLQAGLTKVPLILPTNRGPADSLAVSVQRGIKAKARRVRGTAVVRMPRLATDNRVLRQDLKRDAHHMPGVGIANDARGAH